MPYLIIEVAGKWWDKTKNDAANMVTITEIKADNGNAPLTFPTSGTISYSNLGLGYWNNTGWGKYNLINNDTNYIDNGSGYYSTTGFLVTNDTLDTTNFARFVLQIAQKPAKLDFWVGSPEWRIPKQIKAYYCETYDATVNLSNRQDTGLELLGTLEIPSDLNIVTKLIMMTSREPITAEGSVYSLIDSSYESSIVDGNITSLVPVDNIIKPDCQSFATNELLSGKTDANTVEGEKTTSLYNGLPTSNFNAGIPLSDLKSSESKTSSYQGFSVELLNADRVVRTYDGVLLDSITPDHNDSASYDLMVTPTHQYRSQPVTVRCSRKLSGGNCKYQLKIGDTIIVPAAPDSADVRNVEFTLTSDKFKLGLNKCVLEFFYDNGKLERVPFEVFKEDAKREIVHRTFKKYDGGYLGDRLYPGYGFIDGLFDSFLVPEGKDNTLITTTEFTRIPLARYTAIQGLTIDGTGGRILVSFDKGLTWKKYGIVDYSDTCSMKIITPKMTSNSMNGYVVTCSDDNTSSDAWKAYHAFDGYFYTASGGYFWLSSKVLPEHWIAIKLPKRKCVNGYSMTGYYADWSNVKSWRLEASNDNWATAVVLDVQTNQPMIGKQTYYYYFHNNVEYESYRIVTTASGTNNNTHTVVELELFEAVPIYGWKTVDLADISTEGMTIEEINSTTLAQWSDIFKPTQLDFAIFLNNSESRVTSKLFEKQVNYLKALGPKGLSSTVWYTPQVNVNITRADMRLQGKYNYDTSQMSAAYYTSYRNGVQKENYCGGSADVRVLTQTVYYADEDKDRPDTFRLIASTGDYAGVDGVAEAWFYGAPGIAYIHSITVQATPKLKTGFAFIM